MGSTSNWLAFSLSPHLTVDMPDSTHPGSDSAASNHHRHHNDFSNHGAVHNCYGLHATDTMQMPLRPDGSLCILEARNRTQQNNQDWELKSLENPRSMDSESDVQSQQMIKSELSILAGGSNEHMSSTSIGRHNVDQEGPKLEDFLGGASLGGHYNDARTDSIYGNADDFDDKMISPTLRDVVPNCSLNGFGITDSELSSGSKKTDDPARNINQIPNSIVQQDSYDQNSNDHYNMFPDCSLQLPPNSGANNMIGLSMIKTWLRSQPACPENKMNAATNSNSNPTSAPKDQSLGNLTNMQSLSLSMSPGSQSSSPLALPAQYQNTNADGSSSETKKRSLEKQGIIVEATTRKSIDTFGQRTSIYRGVTRHRWTGRYEAHLWDNSCRREGQTRKGRQVYLGGYDKEEKAARAYDLAALKYWGPTTTTNFPISNYEKELEEMKVMTRQEYVASLRRKSSGFSRGASIYRGVTRHHQHGRWQARIGRVAGNKDLYLGTFSSQEEAAEAYDIAAIKFRGLNAVTNFDMSRYDVNSILESSTLPIGGAAAKRIKEAEPSDPSVDGRRITDDEISSTVNSQITDTLTSYGTAAYPNGHAGWPIQLAFQQQTNPHAAVLYNQQRAAAAGWCKQEQNNIHNHDLQLHFQSSTQNFLQPSMMSTSNANTVLHNLMSLESSAQLDGTNTNCNSGSFFSNISGNLAGNGLQMANSPIPSGITVTDSARAYSTSCENDGSSTKNSGYGDGMLSNSDPFARGLYYLSQHSPGIVKTNYENTAYNNWMTPAVQTLAPRPNLTVCHAPIFTVWNDT